MIHRLEIARRALQRRLRRTALTRRLFAHVHAPSDTERPDEDGRYRRGLVLVQIDGLSDEELGRALARGEMPTLARLIEREGYRRHRLYSGLPSSTPAVQGELFYGVPGAVPACAWHDRTSGELRRMYEPASARAVERALAAEGDGLLEGGSAYCDIYTGCAAEAHFCAASLGWSDVLRGARPHAWAGVALLYLPTLARTAGLAALECLRASAQALRGVRRGHGVLAEAKFVAARVAVVVLLRDLITIGAKVDIDRGLPIVHLNFIGYDEQAHRRGPATRFAHRALGGIDRRIAALWKAAHLAEHRHYDLWIYGDHGQASTEPYARRTGRRLEAALAAGLDACASSADATGAAVVRLDDRARPGREESAATAARCSAGSPPTRAHLLGGRRLGSWFAAAGMSAERPPPESAGPRVAGMGPVAHVLLGAASARTDLARRRLSEWLTDEGEVPAVLFVSADGSVRARVRGAWLDPSGGLARLLGASHPARAVVERDLLALVHHPEAGDLVLLGWAAGEPALSFADEHGAHAGASPGETLSFALLPEDALTPAESAELLRPKTLRAAARRVLGKRASDDAGEIAGEVVSVTASETADAPPSSRRLRVMSYNVHSCIGMDGRLAPERIARVIARQAPDVIALQELDAGRARSDGRDQAAAIAALLGMTHRFHPALSVEREEYGDAILTRLPLIAHRSGALPGPRARRGIEPRGALWVTLDVDGTPVQVLCTHLGLLPGERRVQVAELLSERWLAHPDCRGPTVLCGDLNAGEGSAPLTRLRETLVDARRSVPGGGRRATFPSRRPTLAIDHVLLREVARVERVDVPRTELERLASDHLPLVVDLSFDITPIGGRNLPPI